MKHISFSSLIFKEGGTYVAYCPQLDLSSCGASVDHARKMLREAVWLFGEEAGKMGTLRQILEEVHHTVSSAVRWTARFGAWGLEFGPEP